EGVDLEDPEQVAALAADLTPEEVELALAWLPDVGDFPNVLRARDTSEPPPSRRPYIPVATRRAVYERDGFQCVACGAEEDLSLDHIVPFSKGGPDTIENLRVLCRPCNSRRGNR